MPSTISGTMLVPGVSRNNRLYRKDVIGRAVERMRARIAAGELPITMLTHHDAGDDSLRIVGHLTDVEQLDDGRARFKAALDDTPEGVGIRDRWQAGSLNSVSIRGWWIGDTRTEYMGAEHGQVTTGDDLEVNGLDFTKDPGVTGALLDPPGTPAESSTGRRRQQLITESVQIDELTETVEVDMPEAPAAEAATPTPAAAADAMSKCADPGYLADHTKRLPLGTREAAIATWQHLEEATNSAVYTEAQLKRIRERVKQALRGHGITLDLDGGHRWLVESAAPADVAECWDYPDRTGTVSANITNGPLSVSVYSWCVDPAELDAIARAAMDGACKALAALDPDSDGDIDPAGTTGDDPGMAGETTDPQTTPASAGEPSPSDTPTESRPEKEPTVAQTDTPAAETAATAQAPASGGVIQLTPEQFQQLLNRTAPAPAAEAAPAPAAVETDDQRVERLVAARIAEKEAADAAAQAAQETDDERVERLAEERYQARIQQQVASGQIVPQRKGVQRPTDENNTGAGAAGDLNEHGLPASWPNKPLHKFTAEERTKYMSTAMAGHVLGDRA